MAYTAQNYEASPGKVTINGVTFKSQGAIVDRPAPGTYDIQVDGAGTGQARINELTHIITLTPDGRCNAAVLAALFSAASLSPGAIIPVGACVIHTENGLKRTFASAWIKPNITVTGSTKGTLFGEITIIATKPAYGTALYVDTLVDYDGVTGFDYTEILTPKLALTWGNAAPWDAFRGQNGVQLSYAATTAKVEDEAVGYVADRVTGWEITATLIPVGPTIAQVVTALSHATLEMGQPLANPATLTMSTTGLFIAMTNAVITATAGRTFSAGQQIMGSVTFKAQPSQTDGVWQKPLYIDISD